MSETKATFGNVEVSTYAGPDEGDGESRKRIQITTPTGYLQLRVQQWRWLQAIAMALDDQANPVGGLPEEMTLHG